MTPRTFSQVAEVSPYTAEVGLQAMADDLLARDLP